MPWSVMQNEFLLPSNIGYSPDWPPSRPGAGIWHPDLSTVVARVGNVPVRAQVVEDFSQRRANLMNQRNPYSYAARESERADVLAHAEADCGCGTAHASLFTDHPDYEYPWNPRPGIHHPQVVAQPDVVTGGYTTMDIIVFDGQTNSLVPATVSLDGGAIVRQLLPGGGSENLINIPDGRHTMVVSAPGYQPQSQFRVVDPRLYPHPGHDPAAGYWVMGLPLVSDFITVSGTGFIEPVYVVMGRQESPTQGTLTVQVTDQAGNAIGAASVAVDNQPVGETTIGGVSIPLTVAAGQHTVSANASGYFGASTSVAVNAGGQAVAVLRLQRQPSGGGGPLPGLDTAVLTVRVQDASQAIIPGATVKLSGTAEASSVTNVGGVAQFTATRGNYQMNVARTGYEQQSIAVNLDGDKSLVVTLVPLGGGGGGGVPPAGGGGMNLGILAALGGAALLALAVME